MEAATRPPDDIRPKPPSFAQVLNGTKPNPRSLIHPSGKTTVDAPFITSKPSLYKGEPAFLLSKEEDEKLAAPFQFSLIGKFFEGRPKMEFLRSFRTVGFKGHTSKDCRHVKARVSQAANSKVILKKTDKPNAATTVPNNVWKQREKAPARASTIEDTGKPVEKDPKASIIIDESGNKASSYGLSMAEKLSSIIEKTENDESSWETEEPRKNEIRGDDNGKQLALYVPQINLSTRFDLLADFNDDQVIPNGDGDCPHDHEAQMDVTNQDGDSELDSDEIQIANLLGQEERNLNSYACDDTAIGRRHDPDNEYSLRNVVSDEEGKKKKPGRPKGSTKRRKSRPWMVGGDYNVIRSLEEYDGNSQPEQGAIDDFNCWIGSCRLMELNPLRNLYTWKGNRQNGRVLKRLDRILFNQEWMTLFTISSVHHLSRSTSDHAPLLHRFRVDSETWPSIFQFQKMWMRRNDFLGIVKESWVHPIEAFGMLRFSLKLR
ncbi:OLC1v1036424C1 [Oldenlandia corymbosa var. corymbosa]|uniref:OLC1v1036424C1 n=1 Tax=Oldenlandia corymbosa var. corymbosa TaxID=529605 RepID=A0AAV1CWE2_OLDCO|nr:OLC1v1036424C1 [Oldenlandia corymbosa var. corymbosa]